MLWTNKLLGWRSHIDMSRLYAVKRHSVVELSTGDGRYWNVCLR